jgi:epoxide hydrolase-like predicted phosphatase
VSERVEAVIADFGGVLTTPLEASFARWAQDAGVELTSLGHAMVRATQERGTNPLFELERGELTEAAFLAVVAGALEAEVGRAIPMEGFGERYFASLAPNDELLAYLDGLRSRGVRLALLTNNVREWEPRWRAMLPVDELFETVVDSAFVGMRKPEPGIYALTLERLGLPGAACAFVDDIEINVRAAEEHGIRGVHFRSTGQVIAELEALLDA